MLFIDIQTTAHVLLQYFWYITQQHVPDPTYICNDILLEACCNFLNPGNACSGTTEPNHVRLLHLCASSNENFMHISIDRMHMENPSMKVCALVRGISKPDGCDFIDASWARKVITLESMCVGKAHNHGRGATVHNESSNDVNDIDRHWARNGEISYIRSLQTHVMRDLCEYKSLCFPSTAMTLYKCTEYSLDDTRASSIHKLVIRVMHSLNAQHFAVLCW